MRIAYVCQGGASRGWGHFSRAFTLWESAPDLVTVVIGEGLVDFRSMARRRGATVPTASWRSPQAPLEASEAAADVVVVDDYVVPEDWITDVAGRKPVVVVDDWMRPTVRAAMLLNPNLDADAADYEGSQVETWLLGSDYALMRREVRAARSKAVAAAGPAQEALVTLGGSDPGGLTPTVVAALAALPWYRNGGRITAVLGAGYAGPPPPALDRVTVLRDPPDYVARCASAGVVISAAGTASYELALLGKPFVPLALADNQERVVCGWARHGVGHGARVWQADWLGSLMGDAAALLEDGSVRGSLSAAVARIVDGRGVERVLRALRTL